MSQLLSHPLRWGASALLFGSFGLSSSILAPGGCGEEPPPAGLCTDADPFGEPFVAGTGASTWDTAGDFTVPTLDGSFTLSESWTGCDSYVFVLYEGSWGTATTLWEQGTRELLETSPQNVHFIVMSYAEGEQAITDVTYLKGLVDRSLSTMSAANQEHWASRFHYVTQGALTLDNWVGERLRASSVFSFTIDRLQRIREVGMMNELSTLGLFRPAFYVLGYEPQLYNFEWTRAQDMAAEEARIVPVFQAQPVSDPGWAGQSSYATVTLPSAQEMASYDSLEVDLMMHCEGNTDQTCPDWDYNVELYLCDATDPNRCDTIFARWVTTYHREGRWVTDVSAMMGLIASGGERRFRFYSQQPYVIDLDLRLLDRGKGVQATEAVPLWTGGGFDADYNDRHDPIELVVPSDVKRVELYALITGHGFGADTANCAEFCDHQHMFVVNGETFEKTHPEAGSSQGCVEQIDRGTVPNQYGTWPYGRGGWCPGADVVPFVADVTEAVVPGTSALLDYYALMNGAEYVPEYTGGGSMPNIYLSSWLVYYR